MHLEFELREKNDELAKVKFDQQTNSINELKKANEVSFRFSCTFFDLYTFDHKRFNNS